MFWLVHPALGTSFLTMQMSQHKAIRWLSSKGKNGHDNKLTKEESPKVEDFLKTGKEESTIGVAKEGEASKDGPTESLDPHAFLLGTREHLRKVTEWQVGDMIATYSIVLLLAAILISPVVGRSMRGSESTYDELDTDDQVADLARIIRRDFLDKVAEGDVEDKGVVDSVLADVLSSKALQEQAIKFVVNIVQSDEVKAALQKLLKHLWDDLVKDPETTAQIIFLLNVAIQNEDIRLAAKKLVLEIVEDEEVLEELVRLLQKLGRDQEVLDATQTLLAESAHNALNDPEILDHSMEFATDVVGDDVVQRTAGEALRNTLSYAVQPGMSMLLAATGVGLMFFSIMSLGYARSSEQDAKVLDEAVSGLARSLQPNPRLADRVWNVIVLPFRAVATASSAVFTTVLLPFKVVQLAVARFEYTRSAFIKALQVARTWFVEKTNVNFAWVTNGADALKSGVLAFGNSVGNVFFGSFSWVAATFGSVTSFPEGLKGSTSGVVGSLSLCLASVSRTAHSTAWVSLGVATQFLVGCQDSLTSFALLVTGEERKSRR